MNEVKRYHFSAISCDEPSIGEMEERDYGDYVKLSDFQSERAARIAAETKLAELEDVIAEIAYKKNNNEYGIMRRVIREDSKLFKAIENSKARSKS